MLTEVEGAFAHIHILALGTFDVYAWDSFRRDTLTSEDTGVANGLRTLAIADNFPLLAEHIARKARQCLSHFLFVIR